jgi:sugar phosphate isomerase/epimerase
MILENLSMNISVSNLAWDLDENEKTFKILNDLGINQIEGVITKITEWENLTDEIIVNYKKYLDKKNIKIKSIQSIFFNTGINDFENEYIILNHFRTLINISKILGVNVLVFGSPNLRKKNTDWELKLKTLFSKIDYILEGSNIQLSIEPNSSLYGGEYFFTVGEIVKFIHENNFNNIKTMIDTHNIILENQDPIEIFISHYDYINHIHISEKKLNPFTPSDFHLNFSKIIKNKKYNKTITYEVLKHDKFYESTKNFLLNYK